MCLEPKPCGFDLWLADRCISTSQDACQDAECPAYAEQDSKRRLCFMLGKALSVSQYACCHCSSVILLCFIERLVCGLFFVFDCWISYLC